MVKLRYDENYTKPVVAGDGPHRTAEVNIPRPPTWSEFMLDLWDEYRGSVGVIAGLLALGSAVAAGCYCYSEYGRAETEELDFAWRYRCGIYCEDANQSFQGGAFWTSNREAHSCTCVSLDTHHLHRYECQSRGEGVICAQWNYATSMRQNP